MIRVELDGRTIRALLGEVADRLPLEGPQRLVVLAAGWLNARAAAFIPLTLHVKDCAVLLDHPRLRVLGAPLDQVFLMKLYAARDRDLDDLRALWPIAGFGSAQHAAEQFWRAYPHAPDDPYLANFIAGIGEATPPGRGPDDQQHHGPAR